jgi:hypothetical protein
MFFYAQLDANNIVIGISQLNGEIDKQDYIKITDFDISLLGKTWDGSTFR